MDMANKIVLYVELDGQIWIVMSDGAWLPLDHTDQIDSNIPILSDIEKIVKLNNNGELTFTHNNQDIVIDKEALQHGSTPRTNNSETNRSLVEKVSSSGALGATTRIKSDGDEVLAQAGYDTRETSFGDDSTPLDEKADLVGALRSDASLTVSIEDGNDQTLNRYEVPVTLIYGSSENLEDGREVSVTVTDVDGNSLTFTATVEANAWSLGEVDLSSLSQGPITVIAKVTDPYENSISANTSSNIDTLAETTVNFEQQAEDGVLNRFEADNETLSGTVTFIEDGQKLTLIITDQDGNQKTYTTTVTAGKWSIEDLDLSGLVDGPLVAEVNVVDVAGNPATSTTEIIKDVYAEISFVIDAGIDGWLNAEEVESVPIHGVVKGVEDGQVITLTGIDSDGTVYVRQVTVIDGKFVTDDFDMSAIAQGTLTITASVQDKAGNPAEFTDTVEVDTQAKIGVQIDTHGDGIVNAAEQGATTIHGITVKTSDGKPITITVTDQNGKILTFETTSNGFTYSITEDLSSLAEGPLTIVATVEDDAGNPATAETEAIKDTIAEVTIEINSSADLADDTLNAAEDNSVQITGTAIGVEDGQTVTVVITDGAGGSMEVTATVSGETWVIDNIDLSGFVDGADNISATASVEDVAGNPATATDTASKDTLAEITANFEQQLNANDSVLNAAESGNETLSGTVTGIENGQTVSITVTDKDGTALTFNATVTGGIWSVTDTDLSSLVDGTLTLTVNTVDVAGNSASSTTTIEKDTNAQLTIEINSSADLADDTLNAAEDNTVQITGTAIGVGDGQTVTVVITDGAGGSMEVTATVSGETWVIDNIDLSGFVDGADNISATASVEDVAGNPATATDTASKDTLAEITANFEQQLNANDSVLNAAESGNETLSGTVTGIENGQTVSITVTDKDGTALTFNATVTGGIWSVTDTDLSSLVDGTLTLTVNTVDVAGNPASSTTTIEKDTNAQLTIEINSSADLADDTLNAAEDNTVQITGTAIGVEDGQTVTVVITDGAGGSMEVTATVSGETWVIDNIDLSGFVDGADNISATASVEDVAGNPATATDTASKDTLAEITANFEQQLNANDSVLNAAESGNETLSGTVTGIENGQTVSITVTDKDGTALTFNATVTGGIWSVTDTDLSSLVDGTLTLTVNTVDVAGNPASSTTTIEKDTNAQLTIEINSSADLADDTLNAAEDNTVQITGTAIGVEDGQTVTVVITDGAGGSMEVTATVSGETWVIDNIDLSGFVDGADNISATATVEDVAGNPATATDTASKDTLAEITANFEQQLNANDSVLNAAESGNETLSGTVTGIEDGQTVSITVTDKDGTALTFNATVTGGIWSVTNTDLSSLVDGTLTLTVNTVDVAGNPAGSTTTIEKDTNAEITANFEQQLNANDSVLNAAESGNETLSGTVTGIENGQTVSITVTDKDGTALTFNATVTGGIWSVTDTDLSSLVDGTLTLTVNTVDVAGNSASSTTTIEKDTNAQLTIEINSSADLADDTLNAAEDNTVQITGTAIGVEDGQTVTVVITDGAGGSMEVTATVSGETWVIDNIDLSGFVDGADNISATASVEDVAGNPATATDTASKDTLAEITANFEQQLNANDSVLNAAESGNETLSGTVTGIEDGQTVFITVTDKDGVELTFTALITAGVWSIPEQDFSHFSDGELTVTVETTDIAGNPATATNTIVKDTVVVIDIDTDIHNGIDGYPGYNTQDFMLGIHKELAGSTDAEEGQIVTVTISDGTSSVSFDGVVGADGRWLVNNIDISTLDNTKAWDMSASVTDKAGNTAVDEMPELSMANRLSFSESGLANGAVSGSTYIDVNSPNIEYSFTPNQPYLADLSSEGQLLTAVLSNDGLSIEVRRADGKLVMNAVIDPGTNSVSVTMFMPLDHEVGSDSLSGLLSIKVVQTDDDGTTETSVMPVNFDVADSFPTAVEDTFSVTEDMASTGNLLTNDSAIDGSPVIKSVTVDGTTKAVAEGGEVSFSTDKGVLTVSYDGTWTFIAAHGLDNNIEQKLEFTYEISDFDGDIATAPVTIIIEDGIAGSMVSVDKNHTEPTVTIVTDFTKNFTITAGSDDLSADTVRFTDITLDTVNGLGLTSNGQAITFTFNGDKSILTGSSASGIVFIITLSATNNGADLNGQALLQQLLPVDHLDKDALDLKLGIQATDTDGTTSTPGNITWTIKDGINANIVNDTQADLNEASLDIAEVVANGTFTVSVGSDYADSIAFDPSKQPDLTSGGEPVLYKVEGGVLIAYVAGDPITEVFTVELTGSLNGSTDSAMGYTVTLKQAVDQLEGGVNQGVINIPIVVTVTDSDNDITDQDLLINITDSGDIIVTGGALAVTETPEATGSATTDSDQAQITITANQDPITSITLNVTNNQAVVLADGSALTQNGEAVLWKIGADGNYKGVLADGTVVFEVQLPADINIASGQQSNVSISFVMVGAVDHDKGLGNDTNLTINLPVLVADSDNTNKQIDITTDISDGKNPALSVSQSLTMDEGDLENGKVSDQAEISIITGSDEVTEVKPVLAGEIIPGLTSGGLEVKFNASPNDNGWWIAKSSNGPVFKVRFNLDGTVETQLLGAVDHPDGSGENVLTVAIDIIAVDADGDSSVSNTINLDIVDDIPEVNNLEVKLVEGDTVYTTALLKNVGADGGSVTKVWVNDTAYNVGEVIALSADGIHYANLIINSDGTGSLEALVADTNQIIITDSITYEVTDKDGDKVISEINVVVADEFGGITLDATEGLEDTPIVLTIKVYVGDIDNNENVEKIIIKEASLGGGTLFLDGVQLTAVGGEYILSGSQITAIINGEAQPNGVLTFVPALNSSNQTASVTIDVEAEISKTTVEGDPVSGNVTNSGDISVISDADAPIWNEVESDFVYSLNEDDPAIELNINADLFDSDGSETLSYKISAIDAEVILTLNGQTVSAGDILTIEEMALLKAQVAAGIGGSYTFTVIPVATESENNDVADGAEKVITLDVTPVADKPTLAASDAKGFEDSIVLLNKILNGTLTDDDGSETLSYLITVPAGWSVVFIEGYSGTITVNGSVYEVSAADVEAGIVGLLPAPHVSSETGTFNFTAQAKSTETAQGGIEPNPETALSDEKSFEVKLGGVADIPIVTPGGDWSYDDASQVISNSSEFLEDQLIALNILISTADIDGSESINLLLSDLPDGFMITDALGNEISLPISGFDGSGNPIYHISLEDFQSYYLKPKLDFSGKATFTLDVVVAESDGDAKPDGGVDDSKYKMSVEIEITPVIDSTADNINISDDIVEDTLTALDLYPSAFADSDGSETLTAFTISALPSGMALFIDGAEVTLFPADLSAYLTGGTFEELLSGGRITVKPPTDASGTFQIDISYEITDTSDTGLVVSETFTDTAEINVSAEVEDGSSADNTEVSDYTRLEADQDVQVNENSTPIALDGLVLFNDADIDGSEVIDYFVIQVPSGDDWLVTYSGVGEVIHDGEGRWLIKIDGLTSSAFQEQGMDLLAGISVYSWKGTELPSQIAISARIIDGSDAEMINTSIQVHFKGDGTETKASDILDLQIAPIIGQESDVINIGSQINTSVAGDNNDILSFKVLAKDLPPGASLSGAGVIADYDSTGKYVVQYLFTEEALATLTLHGLDTDFAGTFEIPITAIATDGDSGDTWTEQQNLQVEVLPVVDGATLMAGANEILEDTLTVLDLNVVFADSNVVGEGIESFNGVTGLTLFLVDGGTLSAPNGVLTDLGGGKWQVNDFTRINEIAYQAPLHYSGPINIEVTANIVDTANGYSGTNTDTGSTTSTITLDILPVTDTVDIVTDTSRGNEDSYILLDGLDVQFVDNDGSEVMFIEISGVPAGSVLAYFDGSNYILLPNNGTDGGTFNGAPTYTWSVTPEQMAGLVIKPPFDFSGDIPLSVTVTGYEKGTEDYVVTEGTFDLEVLPIGDTVDFLSVPEAVNGVEGDISHFSVIAKSSEALHDDGVTQGSDETLLLTVRITQASVDAGGAFDRIIAGGQEAAFKFVNGVWIATLEIPSNLLNGFDLVNGVDTFGDYAVQISVATVDTTVVGGVETTHVGPENTIDSSLSLSPIVDIPRLILSADSIFAVVGSESPLSMFLELTTPAASETGWLEISGLPVGISISGATENAGIWTISQENLANAMLSGLDNEQIFELSIVPVAELGADTASGNPQLITVDVQADTGIITGDSNDNIIVAGGGDDVITGGLGNDQFVFNAADQGLVGTPANDQITDFTVGNDNIDLSNLLASVAATDGIELDAVLDLNENAGTTTISIKTDGTNVLQNIVLTDTSIDELYGSSSSGVSEADILTKLIEDQTLITGQG